MILAIDQGTTSTRAILFDRAGDVCGLAQREHAQHFPRAGWVEHDATEIWENTRAVVEEVLASAPAPVEAVGITNQRETVVVWDRATGEPVCPAIVWQDMRTGAFVDALAKDSRAERLRRITGLPMSPYFSGSKLRWVLENVPGVRERAEAGEVLFGTIDAWLLWKLTDGAVHATDVTNASRTQLMDLETLSWDAEALELLGVPRAMLPEIRSSSEVYGEVSAIPALAGVPIAGILGDQQAATFGQACFTPGMAKNTYGTGNFLLKNTGHEPVVSEAGLITTVAYKLGEQPPVYALEGSVAVTGSLVQWLRDNLRMIESAAEVEELALSVPDNGGAFFVPAFSGLFAPHWRSDARGVLVGLTRYVNRGHLARAVLEATAFQTRELIDAMNADSEADLTELRVDGGMVANSLLMQFQADMLGVDVVKPRVTETTALGAAYAAGIAVGFWAGVEDVTANWAEDQRWHPSMDPAERERLYRLWKKAVQRTLNWVDDDVL